MAVHRVERATEEIRRELAALIRELKDPRITGMLSIVNLQLTNDYSHCTVYISSLEGMEQTEKAVEGLQSASGYLKRELGKRIKIRRLPELHFVADDGIAYSANIGKIINEINAENPKEKQDED